MATRQTDFDVRSVIETARLRLEPWDDSHFEHFAHFMGDPDVTRWVRPEPLELDRAVEQHERSLEEWAQFGFGKRAVIEAETNRWLGFVELSQVGPGKGSRDDDVELGYFVEPSRWGEGIATEAAIATRDEAFDRCGVNELIGRCRVENTASARVLAKVGFRRLRLFELDDGIVVEIHRIQRAHWTVPAGRRERTHQPGKLERERTTVKRGSRLAVADPVDDEARRLRRRVARGQPATLYPEARPRSCRGIVDRGRRRAVDGRRRPRRRRRAVAADLYLRRVAAGRTLLRRRPSRDGRYRGGRTRCHHRSASREAEGPGPPKPRQPALAQGATAGVMSSEEER